MLRTLPQSRDFSHVYRLAGIGIFTIFTAIAAQLEIRIGGPVPFTLQVLAVLLSGMVLGARDGALSQVAYLALIRMNLPVAAGGVGAAALFGPTAGYLIGFIPAAWGVGYLVERGANRIWQRWLAGVAGIAIIYLLGVTVLRLLSGLDWQQAWTLGAAPFLGLDLLKAVLAASLMESGRLALYGRSWSENQH